jgi:hypothetical protein
VSDLPNSPEPAGDTSAADSSAESARDARQRCCSLHLSTGWWTLLLFLTLGFVLEVLHGFRSGWYLNVDVETRRLMLRLAHAHGTLLAVLNLVFAGTIVCSPNWHGPSQALASRCLLASTIMLPAGFILGGLFLYGSDPGWGIVLVPAGAVLLFVSVLTTAQAVRRSGVQLPRF